MHAGASDTPEAAPTVLLQPAGAEVELDLSRLTAERKIYTAMHLLLERQLKAAKVTDAQAFSELQVLIDTHMAQAERTGAARMDTRATSPAAMHLLRLLKSGQTCEDRCVVLRALVDQLGELHSLEAEIARQRIFADQQVQVQIKLQAGAQAAGVGDGRLADMGAGTSFTLTKIQNGIHAMEAKVPAIRASLCRRAELAAGPPDLAAANELLAALEQCARTIVNKDQALKSLASKIRMDEPAAQRSLIEQSSGFRPPRGQPGSVAIPAGTAARPVRQLLDIRARRTGLASEYAGLQQLTAWLKAQYADQLMDHDYAQAELAREHHLENMKLQVLRLEQSDFSSNGADEALAREELRAGQVDVAHSQAEMDAAVARLDALRLRLGGSPSAHPAAQQQLAPRPD